MFEKNAKALRDVFLALALLIFVAGVVDVVMLGLDLSFGTGIMRRMGLLPKSFANAAIFCALASIACGVIHLDRSRS